MFGSETLEVGIGVILFFLLVSLICSAAREAIETFSKARAGDLERGLREMLDDPDGSRMVRALFAHGQISSLFAGRYDPDHLVPARNGGLLVMSRAGRGNLPSYIPAGQFANALIDLVARGRADPDWPYPPPPAATLARELSVAQLREEVAYLPDGKIQRALLAAIDHGAGDLARIKGNLELWYDGTMDRVSGWYKRRTQLWLFAIGLLAAAVLNLDTITVTHRLVVDKTVRQAFVAQAEKVAAGPVPGDAATPDVAALQGQIQAISAPVGWSPWPQAEYGTYGWLVMVAGWLVTAAAVSFGAPFWFDLLNKFMVIRSTVKPREKSQEEGSEDRPANAPAMPAPPLAAPPPPDAALPAPAPVAPPPPPPQPDDAALGFVPEAWRPGFVNLAEVVL